VQLNIDLSQITPEGVAQQTISGTSANQEIGITIPVGTAILTLSGTPPTSISITSSSNPPPPPTDNNIIGLAYDFEPSGTTFNPPITLDWNYDPAALPSGTSETDLQVSFFDSATSSWIGVPVVVDTVNHKITATVSHFTTFALMAPVPAPTPTPTPTTTSSDTTPPYTSGWKPAKGATDVSANTKIVVHVRDDGEGVDFSTIKMTVQGGQVSPTITGTPADYTVTYDPSANFQPGQVIAVTVAAKDLANPPNAMATDIYNFTIGEGKSGSSGSVWPAVLGGLGGALLIALGAFLLITRRRRAKLA
jgi:hypothetical protein